LFQVALAEFERIYPGISMGGEMRGFLEVNWGVYGELICVIKIK
jgi:hypothetical protein